MSNFFYHRHGKSKTEGTSMTEAALDGNLTAKRLDEAAKV